MTHLFRLFMAAGLVGVALLLLLVALARNDADLLGPVNFLLFLTLLAVYLLPSVLSAYRNCESALWIAVLNVFLGWTIVGWVAALGWASSGKIRPVTPSGHHPSHPLPSH
jgi:hypothetical protein